MHRAALLLVCGCNSVFGIDTTGLVDAPPPPPPIDAPAPFTCPPVGTAPTFGTDLTMLPARECVGLVADAKGERLAAICQNKDTSVYDLVSAGPASGPLAPIEMDTPAMLPYTIRLAPEGDVMFLTEQVYNSSTFMYEYPTIEYSFNGTSWTRGKAISPPGLTPDTLVTLGSPTRGPMRRFTYPAYNANGNYDIVEFEWNGTDATPKFTTSIPSETLASIQYANLTSDGLRLLVLGYGYMGGGGPGPLAPTIGYGNSPVHYMHRESIDEAFKGPIVELESVPSGVDAPYMTEDCGRIYFGALETSWYLEQPR